jgi:hypothetical protein
MYLNPIPLTETKLELNYNYWKELWTNITEPNSKISEWFNLKLCTTHSFPFVKKNPTGEIIPYQSIFSDLPDKGILSNGYRKLKNINPDDHNSSRNIPNGLENYVFSYLGIHQPYYSRVKNDKLGILSKPFGVFIKCPLIKPETEKFPHNHASRRDIGEENTEVDQSNIDLEFLLPRDARRLMSYQICNDQDHNRFNDQIECFWHYYGNMKYWSDNTYATESWKKKAEFRFFEKLDISDISAILWPVWIEGSDGISEQYSKTHEDLQIYSKKFPNIKFITYDLDLTNPEISFVEASYIASFFFLENNKFPEDISIAKNVLDLIQ